MKKSHLLAGAMGAAFLAFAFLNPTIFSSLHDNITSQPQQPAASQLQVAEMGSAQTSVAQNKPAKTMQLADNIINEKKADIGGAVSDVKKEKDAAKPAESSDAFAGKSVEAIAPSLPQTLAPAAPSVQTRQEAAKTSMRADIAVNNNRVAGMIAPIDAPINAPINDSSPAYHHANGQDKFEHIQSNPVKSVKAEPVSTFSVDVDSSSYSFMRAALNNNMLPQKDAVRIEEMVNYFPYDYAVPDNKNEPFKPSIAIFPAPWNKEKLVLHIGIKGYQLQQTEKPHSNLVFLIDTSGSMNEPNKLPLLKNSLKLLLESLQPEDSVAIVTYAGNAGTALEPTKVKDKTKILSTLDNLGAGGSTAGAEGIRQAYQLAEQNFDRNGVNRVILATDGDFNVGITNQNELKSFIERKRDSGVFLSVLGFGQGNYNDALMQTLAQNGNGNAAYIDNLNEARKLLIEEASATLFPIAKDVKIQLEFNPAHIAEYRLIGYENRLLQREDFNNDKVDAGEIGAGHAVTALYELTPVGSKEKLIDDLRYQSSNNAAPKVEKDIAEKDAASEYGFLKIRYKLPNEDSSHLISTPIAAKQQYKDVAETPTDIRFATAVAAFGQLLRADPYTKNFTHDDVIKLAESGKGSDNYGYRAEFINLVRLAKTAPALPTQE